MPRNATHTARGTAPVPQGRQTRNSRQGQANIGLGEEVHTPLPNGALQTRFRVQIQDVREF